MDTAQLQKTTKKLLTLKKGILAADKREGSSNRYLQKYNLEPSPENRREYRDIIITTPTLQDYINGIILSDETFWQKSLEGNKFIEILKEKDIEPIIKVDGGTAQFRESEMEKRTQGLDELALKLKNYYENGATAAKWRTVFYISENTPTEELMIENANSNALYALSCQKNNIVPIIEPEILLDGDHTIEQAKETEVNVLKKVFETLGEYGVNLEYTILKTSMVLAGKEYKLKSMPEEVGQNTVEAFKQSVPKELPGIVFLSGGQSPVQATENLNAIAKANDTDWVMTFSFLRAISGPMLQTWAGKKENKQKAQDVLVKKLELDCKATQGLL